VVPVADADGLRQPVPSIVRIIETDGGFVLERDGRPYWIKGAAGRPQCPGSYTFHWSQHHEKTHTWYGIFLPDGSPTEAVDAMTEIWTGRQRGNGECGA